MRTRNDRNGNVVVVIDADADLRVDYIKESAYDQYCQGNCGRLIKEAAPYAYISFGRRSELSKRLWNGTYAVNWLYHWECTPDDILPMLKVIFPRQEWKARGAA